MCLAIPGQIRSLINEETALVDIGGVAKEVDIELIEDPVPGDWVIVHVGFALNRIDEEEARRTLAALEAAGTPLDAECAS